MNTRLLTTLCLCVVLLAGCGENAKQQGVQDTGLRQYDKTALARGERVFLTNCAGCHGNGGEGRPGWQQPGPDGKLLPPPLDGNGRVWRFTSSQMKQFIHQGSPDGRANMPAWQGKLTEQQISDLVTWITSLWPDQVYLNWKMKTEHPTQ